jgi:rare lipoprotein A
VKLLSSFAGYAVLVIIILSLAGCATVQVTSKTPERYLEIGMASYYAHKFHGRSTASGDIYDENRLTVAHRTLPFGTLLRVTNLSNNKSVILKVNDRGPQDSNRIIDVSYKAAQQLYFVQEGTAKVRVEVVERNRP